MSPSTCQWPAPSVSTRAVRVPVCDWPHTWAVRVIQWESSLIDARTAQTTPASAPAVWSSTS